MPAVCNGIVLIVCISCFVVLCCVGCVVLCCVVLCCVVLCCVIWSCLVMLVMSGWLCLVEGRGGEWRAKILANKSVDTPGKKSKTHKKNKNKTKGKMRAGHRNKFVWKAQDHSLFDKISFCVKVCRLEPFWNVDLFPKAKMQNKKTQNAGEPEIKTKRMKKKKNQ